MIQQNNDNKKKKEQNIVTLVWGKKNCGCTFSPGVSFIETSTAYSIMNDPLESTLNEDTDIVNGYPN